MDIINPKSEIVDNVRIIRHKYNLFQPWQCELELGDPNERLVEKLKASFDTNAFIDRMFDSMGNMSGKKLVDGSVINNKIADAAIDASKINVGVIFVLLTNGQTIVQLQIAFHGIIIKYIGMVMNT